MSRRIGYARHVVAGAGLALVLLTGCRKHNSYAPPPPPKVGVAHPLEREVVPRLDATGTVTAYNDVDLEARVQGFVQSIDYKDGQQVTAGTRLFTIEPAPYTAKLQQAHASLEAAEAQYAQADAEYRRQSSLGRSDFASRSAVDQAKATRDTDKANIANAEAGVALASINLSYTHVTAPFAGVVTNHLVSVGELVGVSGPTKLASVVQLSPIYVTFSISEQDVQRIRADLARAGIQLSDTSKVPVEVGLMTEQGTPHQGVLDYAAPQVDPGTGTLALRAVFANKDRALLPGYFVRVRVPLKHLAARMMLVPAAALGTAQSGHYLLVVDKADMVEQRPVTLGPQEGSLQVIGSGLKPDDRVVVTGLSRAIPGAKVAPETAAISGG
ncbi:MAG: efflux RND transporter periplasmic adaptor subunit [Rhodospirillales bacterium]|jgi:RND family efflux transporter MFP subunit|nr:efflux RND transporter periplasmic adaptor subunit [Rhodospirillales bacterium]